MIRKIALAQIEMLKSPQTVWLDARGNTVSMPCDFGAPRKATDLSINGRGERKKFIDYVHVSQAKKDDGTVVFAILVEVEIKMPRRRPASRSEGRTPASTLEAGICWCWRLRAASGGRN
ncbi:hypothetical protein GCM10009712_20570 [Pseudarthrobacter sulfonivorans]|uniref:hypothetical protein n=1 Tax=Pseudarthrobacter sulfonivorans TaxID=121292 RepID=UPI00168A4C2F|nr:hypothetical protein [Pseudarthrobacter sulfonivorans]